MITFSLAIFETRNKDNHIFSVKDDYLAIGNGPETIENHDTKKLAGICFWQAIRNAWSCVFPVFALLNRSSCVCVDEEKGSALFRASRLFPARKHLMGAKIGV